MQLLSQARDEHDGRIVRVADLVVTQFDTAADVDNHLLWGYVDTRSESLREFNFEPAFRR